MPMATASHCCQFARKMVRPDRPCGRDRDVQAHANFNGAAKLYYSVSDGASARRRIDITVSPSTMHPWPAPYRSWPAGPDAAHRSGDASGPCFRSGRRRLDGNCRFVALWRYGIDRGWERAFILFTPTSVGTTSFYYTVSDGALSATAVVGVSVPAMAVIDTFSTAQNTPIVLNVAAAAGERRWARRAMRLNSSVSRIRAMAACRTIPRQARSRLRRPRVSAGGRCSATLRHSAALHRPPSRMFRW